MPAAEVGSNEAPNAADLGAALAALEILQPGSFRGVRMTLTLSPSPLLLVSLEGPDPALRDRRARPVHSADDRRLSGQRPRGSNSWPIARFPVLVEESERADPAGGQHIARSTWTATIRGRSRCFRLTRIPEVRLLDRFFDNYSRVPSRRSCQTVSRRRPPATHKASMRRTRCSTPATGRLDRRTARGSRVGRWRGLHARRIPPAAPALFYADWVHPMADAVPNVRGLSRPTAGPAFGQAGGHKTTNPSATSLPGAARPCRD